MTRLARLAALFVTFVSAVEAGVQSSEPIPFGHAPPAPAAIELPGASERTVQLLVEALASATETSRRVELIRDLGECRVYSASPAIKAAIADADASVRAQAARSAGMIGDPSLLLSLEALSSDVSPRVRVEAVRAGALLRHAPLIAAGLNDADLAVFTEAARGAWLPEHADRIAARLPDCKDRTRVVAIQALGRQRSLAYLSKVEHYLTDPDVEVVLAAVEAVSAIDPARSEALISLLKHPHPTVRRAALQAAEEWPAEIARRAAEPMVADADPTVTAVAALVLAKHPSPSATASLLELLESSDALVRAAAQTALAASVQSGDAVSTLAVTHLLKSVDPARREDASIILGGAKSRAAIEQHLALLDDSSAAVVAAALRALGEIKAPEASTRIAAIVDRAAASNDWLSVADSALVGRAFISGGQLQVKSVLPIARSLINQKTSCPYGIRGPAIWAAGVLGSRDDAALAGQLLSVYRDNSPYEVEEARIEAMAALANLDYQSGVDEIRKEAQEHPLPELRFAAYCALVRLTGDRSITYVPPRVQVVPPTSLRALPAK